MREWGQFTQAAINEFESTLNALVEYVDTTVKCENTVRTLAAGFVYFNGGVDNDGRSILALPNPPEGVHLTETDWIKIITYMTDGYVVEHYLTLPTGWQPTGHGAPDTRGGNNQ